MIKLYGFYTGDNNFEVLADEDIARKDLLSEIYTTKGECDWNPDQGTTIMEQIFQIKTEGLKQQIEDEIRQVFNNNPLFNLIDLQTNDIDKGWVFSVKTQYTNNPPSTWNIEVSENVAKLLSNGQYPLRGE